MLSYFYFIFTWIFRRRVIKIQFLIELKFKPLLEVRMSCSYLLNKLKFWCSRVTSHKFLCKSKTNLTLLMLNIFPTCFGFQKNWKLYLVQSKRSFCGVECLIWFDSGGKKIFDLKIFFPITMYIFLIIILFKKIGKTKNFVSKISVIFLDKIFKILYASLKS